MPNARGHAGIHSLDRRIELELIETIKLKQRIERILHEPGNDSMEKNPEMTVVIDWNLEHDQAKATTVHVMKTLKTYSERFKNARLNVVSWKSNEEISGEIVSMQTMIIGKYCDHFEPVMQEKSLDCLVTFLKDYQTRSRIIIIVSDGTFYVADRKQVDKEIHPLLIKKTMLVCNDEVKDESREL